MCLACNGGVGAWAPGLTGRARALTALVLCVCSCAVHCGLRYEEVSASFHLMVIGNIWRPRQEGITPVCNAHGPDFCRGYQVTKVQVTSR